MPEKEIIEIFERYHALLSDNRYKQKLLNDLEALGEAYVHI
jgi:hypothetical protein